MSELREHLQELADSAALVARMPEPAAIARRGRRRRRLRAGGVALVAVTIAAGTVSLSHREPRTAVTPAAVPTTQGCAPSTPAAPDGPRLCRAADGRSPLRVPALKGGVVVGSGTHHGVSWRVVAAVSARQVCWQLQEGNGEHEGPACIPTPVDRLAWSEGPWQAGTTTSAATTTSAVTTTSGPTTTLTPTTTSGRGAAPEKLVFGIASQDTARVRLTLKRGASLDFKAPSLPPVDAQVINGGQVVPAKFFLAFLPHTTSVAQAESFTAAGASICRVLGDDFKTPNLPMGCTTEPMPGG
jgi:hypothetical protein